MSIHRWLQPVEPPATLPRVEGDASTAAANKEVVRVLNFRTTELPCTELHPALALFDLFAAHRCRSVLAKLQNHNIHEVFIPAGCTGELQPLDVGVNQEFKQLMKNLFSRWYAEEVREALDQGV